MGFLKSVTNGIAHGVQGAVHKAEQVGEAAVNKVVDGAKVVGSTARDVFERAEHAVETPVRAVVGAIRGGGPDVQFDGAVLGANGEVHPGNVSLDRVTGIQPRNGRTNDETLIFVNGINTSKDGQLGGMQALADASGSQVIGIHNSTEGFVKDLEQCLTDKLDKGKNPAVDTLADQVYKAATEGRSVHIVAHSQGGLITSRALTHARQRLIAENHMTPAQAEQALSKIKVETFGAAAAHYPDGPQYVHYVNRGDPVPSMFGLGWTASDDPAHHAGKGAVVREFNELHANPIAAHSFDQVYLQHRVPFDQARAGRF